MTVTFCGDLDASHCLSRVVSLMLEFGSGFSKNLVEKVEICASPDA